MKIGILTFHRAHNYGAVLQAYALQETLKEMGHDVEIIDYNPFYLIDPYKPFLFKSDFTGNLKTKIKKIVLSLILLPIRSKRWLVFNKYINTHFNLSHKCNTLIPQNYDLYIIGSDQIWNKRITRGFDKAYWGFFKIKEGANKITYAASFGDFKNISEEEKYIEKALLNFNGISLRENEYLDLIKSISEIEIYKVLDPTFILDNLKWSEKAIKPEIKSKYVLIYQVSTSPETTRIAKEIAKQLNTIVVEISADITTLRFNKIKYTVSPFEFIGWIKYAECIITTSFHGTAFSIILEKDFYMINLENGSEKRSRDILLELDLIDRMIPINSSVDFEKISYTRPYSKVNVLKQNSLKYLNSYLK